MRKRKQSPVTEAPLTSLEFFSRLVWLDGRSLLDTIEPYRRHIFTAALDTVGHDGLPRYNFVLAGRGKKNWKSADLVLAGLYKLVIGASHQGSDGLILGNDEGQAADDLSLAKKLVEVNPNLMADLETFQKELKRRDGRGILKILPAQNVVGQHGKTAAFIGYDEIHGYRSYDLFEALAVDPTRRDCLQWVTSYDTIYNTPGVPLHDLKQIGFAGTDPRMLFSWYSGDRCTDPDFAELPPEQRANPSMASWTDGERYLEQQRTRLPTHKFRRLHLNLPGAPNNAFFDQSAILAAVVQGRKSLPPRPGIKYVAAVDMSGGTNDNCVLCVCHEENGKAVVDLIEKQAGNSKPFDPMRAVAQFAERMLYEYGCTTVIGDAFGGDTFGFAFQKYDITFRKVTGSASDQYEAFEPRLNAGEVQILDDPVTIEELLTLVVKGTKVTHESGSHDDHANALALAVNAVLKDERGRVHWHTGDPALDVYLERYKHIRTWEDLARWESSNPH